MTPETEFCQLTDAEVLGALSLAGLTVNTESPFASLGAGVVSTPPSEQVQASLMRKGILAAPQTVQRNWIDVLQVLSQPLWSLAVVLGSREGFAFYEYFAGGSLRAPRLVCHRADDEGTRHISFFYSLDALMMQLSEIVDVDGPIPRVLPIGDFSPKEFMLASTLLDVFRQNYFRSLLERQTNTPLEFSRDELMSVFTDGLSSDDTRWFVTLCDASLPFEFNLHADDAADLLHTMASRGWVEITSEQGFQYRLSESLVEIGRLMLLPQAFAAFKVEQLLDGQGQQPRSLSVVRTPQCMWVLEYKSGDGGPVRVSLNCVSGADLQSSLSRIVEEAEQKTPPLLARLAQPPPPRPMPATPAPNSQPTVLPSMAPGGGYLPPPGGPPPSLPTPGTGGGNGPALLRRRPEGIASASPSNYVDESAPTMPSLGWGESSPPYGSGDNGRSAVEAPPVMARKQADASGEVQCVHCAQMINVSKKFCRGCGAATTDSLWAASPTDSSISAHGASPEPAEQTSGWAPPAESAWSPAGSGYAPPTPPPPMPAGPPQGWGPPSVPAAPVWGPPATPPPVESGWGSSSFGSTAPPGFPPAGGPGFPPSFGSPAPPPNLPPAVPFGTSPAYGSGFPPMPPTTPPPVPVPSAPPVPAPVPVAAPSGPPPAVAPGMVPCPVCMNPVSEKARFCGHCGTNITMQRTEATAPTPTSSERSCSGCGFKSSKPTTFCPNCGTRMSG